MFKGSIVISDTIKEEAYKAIHDLKKVGVRRTVMLTGDKKEVGEAVASRLGLDEVHAELLPDGKVAKVEELLAGLHGKDKLAFVGDGINDAPVLSRADIGIAMEAWVPMRLLKQRTSSLWTMTRPRYRMWCAYPARPCQSSNRTLYLHWESRPSYF